MLSKQVDNRIGAVEALQIDATGAMRSWTLEQPGESTRLRWHVVRQPRAHSRRSSRHLGWG